METFFKRPFVGSVAIDDDFWSEYLSNVQNITLPHCFNKFEENKTSIENQYRVDNWNTASGLSSENLETECARLYEEIKEMPREIIKARIFEFIMDNAQIEVNPDSWFQSKINHANILVKLRDHWKGEVENNEIKLLMHENSFPFLHNFFFLSVINI